MPALRRSNSGWRGFLVSLYVTSYPPLMVLSTNNKKSRDSSLSVGYSANSPSRSADKHRPSGDFPGETSCERLRVDEATQQTAHDTTWVSYLIRSVDAQCPAFALGLCDSGRQRSMYEARTGRQRVPAPSRCASRMGSMYSIQNTLPYMNLYRRLHLETALPGEAVPVRRAELMFRRCPACAYVSKM